MYDYESFKKDIYKLTNINLDMYKERQMKRRIESLIDKNVGKVDYQAFYQAMVKDEALLRSFISYLTINVSEFYRNPDQWKMFEDDILPMITKSSNGQLKIWSAACSTGDEPYTIAMILAKHMPLTKVKIYATDLDNDVIAFAKNGVYSKRSVQGLPKELLDNNFTLKDDDYILSDKIKSTVEFRKHNLLEDNYPGDMDMIVCRNVVIYFTEEAKDEVYGKFHKALKDSGVLFIGSTEQIVKSKELGFEVCKSFFYKKIKKPLR